MERASRRRIQADSAPRPPGSAAPAGHAGQAPAPLAAAPRYTGASDAQTKHRGPPVPRSARDTSPRSGVPICSTTPRSWEMNRYAIPNSSCRSSIRFSTCACTDTSSAETGSSATITAGRSDSARAIPSRCRCPPENSNGTPVQHIHPQSHPSQQRPRLLAPLGRGQALEILQRLGHDLRRRQPRIQRRVRILEHHLHAPPKRPHLLRRLVGDVSSLDQDRAL